jgi:hypothetical protein
MIWTDKNDEIEPNASGPEGAQINSSASAPEGAPHTSSERPAIRESEGEYPDYSPVNRSPDDSTCMVESKHMVSTTGGHMLP